MSVTPLSFPTISTGSTGSTGTAAAANAVNPVTSPTGPQGPGATSPANGADFGQMVIRGIDHLESLNDNAANLSVKAATGDLNSIHDYTIAATEATTATQLTVAVTNKAIESFNSIMNMQV